MYQAKLAMNIGRQFRMPWEKQIGALKEVGFDGFFCDWAPDRDIKALKKAADAEGMEFQFIHSDFMLMADMWEQTKKTETALQGMLDCLHDCAENDVGVMVAHAFIGFEKHNPTAFGLEQFDKVMREAEKCGVKIAFENVEGEEYLAALMERYKGHPLAGFCWDTGHEICYNKKDMLALYGDRLLCTHINDNLGVMDFEGKIRWQDDLHLFPFDGIIDWHTAMERLSATGYDGCLCFELKARSIPGRHENDAYSRMSDEEYFTHAYMRACRVAALKQQADRR